MFQQRLNLRILGCLGTGVRLPVASVARGDECSCSCFSAHRED